MLVVVWMIGWAADRGISAIGLRPFFIIRGRLSSESGEAAREGPFGEDVRDRCKADVDLEAAAAVASALALSF